MSEIQSFGVSVEIPLKHPPSFETLLEPNLYLGMENYLKLWNLSSSPKKNGFKKMYNAVH